MRITGNAAARVGDGTLVGIAGHQQGIDRRPLPDRGADRVEAVHARHGEIGQQHVVAAVGLEPLDRAAAVAASSTLEAHFAELLAKHGSHRFVVIDQQHRLAGRCGLDLAGPGSTFVAGARKRRRGEEQLDRRALPGVLSIRSLPPDCWTKPATIDRPRPVPLPASLVVKNGSVTRLTMLVGNSFALVADPDPDIAGRRQLERVDRRRCVEPSIATSIGRRRASRRGR